MAEAYRYPPKTIVGIVHRLTKVKSQPFRKATINPATSIDNVIIMVDTFSPIAPWYAKQSVVNFVASYDWFIISNQPISCFSRLFKYCFLQAIPCLSPVIIQHPNIPHPAKMTPMPM